MIQEQHRRWIVSTVVVGLWFAGTAVLWGLGEAALLPLGLLWMILVHRLAHRWVARRGW